MEFTQADIDLINKEFEELKLSSLKRCATQEELDTVIKAFDFANNAHYGIRRRSGEPYIIHPIAVAKIVVQEIGLGYKSIVTALIHDVVEDTDFTIEDIRGLFGDKIASLVDGLTKIKAAMDSDSKGQLQAENFKRILLTLNDDVRVVLIKLADRLHNLRTIAYMPEYKREKILSESLFIFVPLAHRLGLYAIKTEMENIWLMYKETAAYNKIKEETDTFISERGADIEEFIKPIDAALKKNRYQFEIYKRVKSPYSIWKKMNTKRIDFDQIFDLYAIRVIFQPKQGEEERIQCWHIYSVISGIYTSMTERIRDWVTQPKSNGYEALHCTVMGRQGRFVEVQIRSERMEAIAERGIAAHWTYKREGHSPRDNEKEMDTWLDKVREILENPDSDALQFLDKFHDTLMDKEIYVFTPMGESKSLPKGSTALDFAYSVHSEIGNKSIAAKVNMKLVPLSKVLRNGDQVEIITAESAKPQREWLDFLKTSKAKGYLYNALKDDISVSVKDGREMLSEELQKYNVKLQSRVVKKLVDEYHLGNKEDLYYKISTGVIDLNKIGTILKINKQRRKVNYWQVVLDDNNNKSIPKDKSLQQKITYRVAECCYPIPGDNVTAFIEENGDVTIHKSSCEKALERGSVDGERIVNVKWRRHARASSLARIKLTGVDRIGILNDLTKDIAYVLNINIRKVMIETHDGIFEGYIDCYVKNASVIDDIITILKSIKGIESVTRIVDLKDI